MFLQLHLPHPNFEQINYSSSIKEKSSFILVIAPNLFVVFEFELSIPIIAFFNSSNKYSAILAFSSFANIFFIDFIDENPFITSHRCL